MRTYLPVPGEGSSDASVALSTITNFSTLPAGAKALTGADSDANAGLAIAASGWTGSLQSTDNNFNHTRLSGAGVLLPSFSGDLDITVEVDSLTNINSTNFSGGGWQFRLIHLDGPMGKEGLGFGIVIGYVRSTDSWVIYKVVSLAGSAAWVDSGGTTITTPTSKFAVRVKVDRVQGFKAYYSIDGGAETEAGAGPVPTGYVDIGKSIGSEGTLIGRGYGSGSVGVLFNQWATSLSTTSARVSKFEVA